MPESGTTDLKVQIEGLKKDVENVANLNSRLDLAIEKLTDVSTSIKQMLAVHEEKIARQEQVDEIIFEKLKERGLNGYKLIKKYEWKFQAKKMKQLYEYALNGKNKPDFIY